MKRITLMAICLLAAIAMQAQQIKYTIKYTYAFDVQKNDYIKKLDYAEGTVIRDGDKSIVLNGLRYIITSKDEEKKTSEEKTLQYTVKSEEGTEYVVCFKEYYTYPAELVYQIIIFNTSNPYQWLYYITEKPENI